MKLTAQPDVGLVDEPVSWRLSDPPPGATVTLTVTGTDGNGHRWSSTGEYTVGPDGAVQIDDPEQVFTGMRFVDEGVAPVTFAASTEPWSCTATATVGDTIAETTIQRLHRRDVASSQVSGAGFLLTTFVALSAAGGQTGSGAAQPAVLVVPGSSGSAAVTPRAALLASHGYPTAVLSYMQDPGLPPSLRDIPVEVLHRGAAAFATEVPVAGRSLVVWANSVGTELVLAGLSAAPLPGLAGVVVMAPSHLVWQALSEGGPPPKASSLTSAGQPLPWLPIRGDLVLGQVVRHAITKHLPGPPRSAALRLYAAYNTPLKPTDRAQRAAIAVENIDAPLLVVAGTADAMWPSTTMAEAIVRRRREHGRTDDILLTLPDTGHFIGPPGLPTTVDRNADLVSGGTPAGIAHGQRIGWDTALDFIDNCTTTPTD